MWLVECVGHREYTSWACLRVYIEVYDSPMLEEGMNTRNTTCITSKSSPTGCGTEVGLRVRAVQLDYEVSVTPVYLWGLRGALRTEVLWECIFLCLMAGLKGEPGSTRWDHKGVFDRLPGFS